MDRGRAANLGNGHALIRTPSEDKPATIDKNLAKAGFKGRVLQQEVFGFLKNTKTVSEKFGIVFADPPYEKTKSGERFTETLLASKALVQLLEPDGVFILEKRPAEALSEMKLWRVVRQKAYGATEILFLSAVLNPKSTIQQ